MTSHGVNIDTRLRNSMHSTARTIFCSWSYVLSFLVVAFIPLAYNNTPAATFTSVSTVISTDSDVYPQSVRLYICDGGHTQPHLPDLSELGVEYEWIPRDGVDRPETANPTIYASNDRVYLRKSARSGNTVGYDTIQVYVRTRDAVVFAAIDSVCEGVPVMYGIVPDQTEEQRFLWNASTATGTVQGQIVSGQETNIITVMWTGQGSGRIQLRIDYPQSGCVAQGLSIVDVTTIKQPLILPSSLVVCPNSSIVLRADSLYSGYLWSNGETSQSIEVTKPGVYSLVAFGSNGCSKRSETVMIGQSSLKKPTITGPTELCPGTTARLGLTSGFESVLWSDGTVGREIVVPAGRYRVRVWDAYGCSAQSDEFTVKETTNGIHCSSSTQREVELNGRMSGSLTVTNTSSEAIVVSRVQALSSSDAGIVVDQQNTPVTIPVGSSMAVHYTREMTTAERVVIPFEFRQSRPCDRVDTIELEFINAVQPPRARVAAGDVVLVQCGSEFELPIDVDVDEAMLRRCTAAQLHVRMHWDESVFSVTGLIGIESIKRETDQSSEWVLLTFPPLSGAAQTRSFSLRAMALAGGHQQSFVEFDSAWWTNTAEHVSTTLASGSVTLKQHCFPSPIRLGEPKVEALRMYPNPASTTCHVIVVPKTDGEYRCTVLSPTGQKAAEWSLYGKSGNSMDTEFDTERLCDGMYTLIMQSDAEQHCALFGVIH